MTNTPIENLPPEMQARLAQIMQNATSPAPPEQPVQALQPTMADYIVDTHQTTQRMMQQIHSLAQVVDAMGQAINQMYVQNQSLLEQIAAREDAMQPEPVSYHDGDF